MSADAGELDALERSARAFEAAITMEANPLDLSERGDTLAAAAQRALSVCAGDPSGTDRVAAIARRIESTRRIVAQLVALKRTQLCC